MNNTTEKTPLKPWGDFKPTVFDRSGMGSSPGWFVAPCGRNRDSGPLDNSNFETALAELRAAYTAEELSAGAEFAGGGPEDSPEDLDIEAGEIPAEFGIGKYGHWACGWFEILVVKGGTRAESKARDLAARLEDYPILDEGDYSERTTELAQEAWDSMDEEELTARLVEEDCPPILAGVIARGGYNALQDYPMFGLHWFGEFTLHPYITKDGEDKRDGFAALESLEEKIEREVSE